MGTTSGYITRNKRKIRIIMGTTSGYITRNQDLIINMDAANSRSYTSGSTSCNCLVSTVSGTLEGGTSFTSEYKGGWVFGGSNDYINLGNRTKINPELNSFTTNIFFKIDSNSTSSNIIASKGNGADSDIGWLIYYSNTNDILTVRCNGNNTTSERAAQHTSINKGQVYMVTMVINRVDNTIKGYLNGSDIGWVNGNYSQTFSGNSISGFGSITNSDDFLIGERPLLNLPMYGTIYLFQTYNFALSESQVYRNFRFFGGRYDLSVPPPPPSFFNDYSFEFDGTDDFINCGNDSSLYPGTGDMSYSVWIKTDTITGSNAVILGPPIMSTGNLAVDIRRNTNTIQVYVGIGVGGTWGLSLVSTSVLAVGVWCHIALTLDRDGNGVIYVNGSADATGAMNPTYSGTDITGGGQNLQIGGGNDGDFEGNIDEVAIFNSVLSSSNISQIYNGGTPSDLTSLNPITWYRMGDNATYRTHNGYYLQTKIKISFQIIQCRLMGRMIMYQHQLFFLC